MKFDREFWKYVLDNWKVISPILAERVIENKKYIEAFAAGKIVKNFGVHSEYFSFEAGPGSYTIEEPAPEYVPYEPSDLKNPEVMEKLGSWIFASSKDAFKFNSYCPINHIFYYDKLAYSLKSLYEGYRFYDPTIQNFDDMPRIGKLKEVKS